MIKKWWIRNNYGEIRRTKIRPKEDEERASKEMSKKEKSTPSRQNLFRRANKIP